jgi:hypothetical protein
VGDGDDVVRWDARRQFGDQRLHGRDVLGGRAPVLLGPAPDLSLEVPAGPAVVAQPDRREIDAVQLGEREVQLVVDRGPLGGFEPRQPRVAEDAPGQEVHDVERRPDHARVGAQVAHDRHRHARARQRRHHLVLAVHLVRAGQQRPRRLLAEHVQTLSARRVGGEQEGRVRRAALELQHAHALAKAGDVGAQFALQRRLVEPMLLPNLPFGKGFVHAQLRPDSGRDHAISDARSVKRPWETPCTTPN